MGDCEKGLVEVCNPNGSNYFVSGCWRGYNTQYRKMDDCKTLKTHQYYTRRGNCGCCSTTYNSSKDKGFGGVLFSQNVPTYLWLNQAVQHGKGPKNCRYRCKGQSKLKSHVNITATPAQHSGSRTVAPAFDSFETVLAVRKAQAYYDPANFKRSKKWRRNN